MNIKQGQNRRFKNKYIVSRPKKHNSKKASYPKLRRRFLFSGVVSIRIQKGPATSRDLIKVIRRVTGALKMMMCGEQK